MKPDEKYREQLLNDKSHSSEPGERGDKLKESEKGDRYEHIVIAVIGMAALIVTEIAGVQDWWWHWVQSDSSGLAACLGFFAGTFHGR